VQDNGGVRHGWREVRIEGIREGWMQAGRQRIKEWQQTERRTEAKNG